MNTFKIKPRTRANADGKHSLVLVSTLNRKSVVKTLNFSIPLNWWDTKKECVKTNTPEALKVLQLKERANAIALNIRLLNKPINPIEFIEQVLNIVPQKKDTDFYLFYENIILQKEVSKIRLKVYKVFYGQLKLFEPKLTFKDVTYTFCERLFTHIKATYKNHPNTLLGKLKLLKFIINEAVRHNIVEKSQIVNFKIKGLETTRTALSKDEFNVLRNLYYANNLPQNLQNTLKQFLFCCYTGMRYGDLANFTTNNITGEVIAFKQNKTQGNNRIALHPNVKDLLPELNYCVITNQKMNKNLKAIGAMAGITTKITCHVARHTFATIGLNSGMSIDSISDSLGHKSLAVTRVYAKLLDEFRISEIKKWGN